jgi:glycosyltransferase involved in cell wall biosynthesis
MKHATPIRILRIIARMNVGGPAIQITNLMSEMNKNEFEQILVTGYCGIHEKEYFDEYKPDFQVHRISELGVSVNVIKDLIAFLKIFKEIYIFKPHIVHTHTSKAGVIGRVACILYPKKIKIIHTYHGHILYGYFPPWKTRIVILLEKILAIWTHKIITVGETVKKDLISAGIGREAKYLVINPGIQAIDKLEKSVCIKKFNIPENKFIVAFVGRLTKIKRIDRLVEVIKKSKIESEQIYFIIAGGGIEEKYLIDQVEKYKLPVKYLGWVSNLAEIISVSNIFILTSDNEGTPISLIQGLMAGIPAISTNVGSVSDIIDDKKNGILTEANSDSIFEALKMLSSNKEMYDSFVFNALESGKKKFSRERFIQNYEELYIKLFSS